MKKKILKVLALVACAVLLVVGSIAGTLAFLTDDAEVTNTFTVGKVSITMDEAALVDEYGDADPDAERVTANTYKLIPGHTYDKDPTIHVAKKSEDCYLFVRVENNIAGIENGSIATQMAANGWTELGDGVYYYSKTNNGVVEYSEEIQDFVVFKTFTLTDDAEVSTYDGETIVVTAYAVQADGFNTAADAWDATFGK